MSAHAQPPAGQAPALAESLAIASRIVAGVIGGRSLADERGEPWGKGAARGAVQDLVYGTLRRYGRGDAVLRSLSTRSKVDTPVRALLLCALYALESGRYSEHTAVDQAVKATEALHLAPARGFVNAVLRAWTRRHTGLEADLLADPVATYMHPAWWIDLLRTQHPAHFGQMLLAGNLHPPMGLRVNLRHQTAEDCRLALDAAGMASRRVGLSALVLEHPVPVDRLPGFAEGRISVQDAGAQHAARLLDLHDGQRVLDACAAPGGKSGHILEMAHVDLTALDIGRARCERIRENLRRLGLQAAVLEADCTRLPTWWDGRPFDRILADVPCTGSGVVRRHPDIKWLRRPSDAAQFAQQQSRILDALWQVLAPGGKLLYVTCSVFDEENVSVVEGFLARRPDARCLPPVDGAGPQLPPAPEHDGFYFALLEKLP